MIHIRNANLPKEPVSLRPFSLFDRQRIRICDEKLIAARHDTAEGYATPS
jgi:hypothetical protein